MTALGIDCSNREPETWFDQRPSHPVHKDANDDYFIIIHSLTTTKGFYPVVWDKNNKNVFTGYACETREEAEKDAQDFITKQVIDPRSERERHMQSNDATWDELGAGFIEIEPNYDDPRSEEERDLDWLAEDEAATIRSIRPGG
jgi:hypothetical protein